MAVVSCSSIAFADVQSYMNVADFLTNAGDTSFESFEGFSSGTQISSLNGILEVNGVSRFGMSIDVNVLSENDLPFPMFPVGQLPSGTNFLSNDLANPYYGAGTIEFVFDGPALALGFYVADGGGLSTFNITLFNGTEEIGSFDSSVELGLPNSFFGIAGDVQFTSAVIGSNSDLDSWGIDNLYVASVPAPAGTALFVIVGACSMCRRR